MTHELLGSSDGSTDQTFRLSQKPILAGEAIEVREVGATSGEGWTAGRRCLTFTAPPPTIRTYVIDRVSGTPVLRRRSLRSHSHGWGPEHPRVLLSHWGGSAGNRAALKINQLRASIAYLDRAVKPAASRWRERG